MIGSRVMNGKSGGGREMMKEREYSGPTLSIQVGPMGRADGPAMEQADTEGGADSGPGKSEAFCSLRHCNVQ